MCTNSTGLTLHNVFVRFDKSQFIQSLQKTNYMPFLKKTAANIYLSIPLTLILH